MHKHKFCIIGGGHGLAQILRGLKLFTYLDIICDVTDSGGSTGIIRDKMSLPAMGDMRLVMSTLGDEKLRDIFEYRISKYKDCVGNLLIASLSQLHGFQEAIDITHDLLGLSQDHRVIPVSLDCFDIQGKYIDGVTAKKESELIRNNKIEKVWLNPIPKANPEALKAIDRADYVIIAPGSFFSSIMANILVPHVADKISKKKVIWICNLLQQEGETIGMDLEEHGNILCDEIDHIDYAIVNTKRPSIEVIKNNYPGFIMSLHSLKQCDNVKHIIEDDILIENEKMVMHSAEKIHEIIRKIIR